MGTRVISLPCRFGFSVCFLHSVGIHQGMKYLPKSVNLFPFDLCLEYSLSFTSSHTSLCKILRIYKRFCPSSFIQQVEIPAGAMVARKTSTVKYCRYLEALGSSPRWGGIRLNS